MRKLVFLVFFFLLTGANSVVVSFVVANDYQGIEMPFPTDSEESPGEESREESKNPVEEDDDEVGFGHRWISKEKSLNANLHLLYQENLFHDLEFKVVIPPPKA